MKRVFCLLIVAVCLCGIVGCSAKVSGSTLIWEGEVTSISISSIPNGYNFELDSAEKITEILDYFKGLRLTEETKEKPSDYVGMTWVVDIKYSDDRVLTLYHDGCRFLSCKDDIFNMKSEDAAAFEKLFKPIIGFDS